MGKAFTVRLAIVADKTKYRHNEKCCLWWKFNRLIADAMENTFKKKLSLAIAVILLPLHCSLCQCVFAQDRYDDGIKIDRSNGSPKLFLEPKFNIPGSLFLQSHDSKSSGAMDPILDESDLPDVVLPAVPAGRANESSSTTLKGAVRKFGKRPDLKKLNAMESKIASPGKSELDGQISADASEDEISIEWDRWRNKVSKSIWSKFCNYLQGGDTIMLGNLYWKYGTNPPLHFPDNTRATYSVTVDSDLNVVEAKITRSSGIAKFDDIVRRSAESVNKKKFLRFPAGSKRKQISLSLQLFTTKHGGYKDIEFHDVERYTASTHDASP